ncbi:transposase [Savagea faecisuis]|uniref:Transposase n=1 Tax=Savagea faecisuis TaxID=1274803 RepID=A0ABW3GZ16_9BACL
MAKVLDTTWSDGYFSCSIGNASKETIQQYIQT